MQTLLAVTILLKYKSLFRAFYQVEFQNSLIPEELVKEHTCLERAGLTGHWPAAAQVALTLLSVDILYFSPT